MRKKSSRTSRRVAKRPAKRVTKRPVKKFARPHAARATATTPPEKAGPPRLQKVLAAAGFGSRRACEELILAGRVEIDRKIVTELGIRVDLATQQVRVDGQSLRPNKPVYVALFKPKGYLCTHADQQGRKRAVDLLPPELGRLFPVGRLDMHSEGLLLLTNDGELAEQLTHPRYGVQKVYRVLVAGIVTPEELARLRNGIRVAEGVLRVDQVVLKQRQKMSTVLDITLSEGKNREIRRMLAAIGHKVMQLIRLSIGPVKLGKLVPGEWRRLTPDEVRKLRR